MILKLLFHIHTSCLYTTIRQQHCRELRNAYRKREKQCVRRRHGDIRARGWSELGENWEQSLETRQNVLVLGLLEKDYLRYQGINSDPALNALKFQYPLSCLLLWKDNFIHSTAMNWAQGSGDTIRSKPRHRAYIPLFEGTKITQVGNCYILWFMISPYSFLSEFLWKSTQWLNQKGLCKNINEVNFDNLR